MLNFQGNPDIIFTEILNDAFDFGIAWIKDVPELEFYENMFPNACKNFSRDLAIKTLEDLKQKNKSEKLWLLNDYHFVLIYDCLDEFCANKNDTVFDIGKPIYKIKEYKVNNLDFELLIEAYFWDTDFLFEQEAFLNAGSDIKEQLSIDPNTFGVVTGLKPHPTELKLIIAENGVFIPLDPIPDIYKAKSRTYPSF